MKGTTEANALNQPARAVYSGNFKYFIMFRRIVRTCLDETREASKRQLTKGTPPVFVFDASEALVGDMIIAGITAGVAERRCLHRPVIMTNTKCLSRRTKQKAVGCSLYKLIQGSVKNG